MSEQVDADVEGQDRDDLATLYIPVDLLFRFCRYLIEL